MKNTATRRRSLADSEARPAAVRSASSRANPSARCHEGTAVSAEGRIGRGRCGLGPPEVLARAQGRLVGGEHDAHHPVHAAAGQVGHPLLDGGRGVLGPVAHHVPTGVGRLEGGGQPVHLGRVRSVSGEVPPMAWYRPTSSARSSGVGGRPRRMAV